MCVASVVSIRPHDVADPVLQSFVPGEMQCCSAVLCLQYATLRDEIIFVLDRIVDKIHNSQLSPFMYMCIAVTFQKWN